MNNSDYNIVYENLSKKYNLKVVRNDEVNCINLEIESFINNLNNDVKIKKSYINMTLTTETTDFNNQLKDTGILYLSKRLVNFLLASDYIISNTMDYTKLHTQIRNITDHYSFKKVKNTDNEIYNELKKIIQSSHIVKGKLITNFIKMYTNTQHEIKINL